MLELGAQPHWAMAFCAQYVVLQDTVHTVSGGGGMHLGAAASELARVDEHDVIVDNAPLEVWGLGFKV